MTYAKTVAMIVATGLSAAVVALGGDNTLDNVETINIAIAVVGAIGVFYVPNAANGPVAKAVVAVLMAVLTLAVNLISDGITLTEWLQLGVAALGALGVYGLSNEQRPPHVVT